MRCITSLTDKYVYPWVIAVHSLAQHSRTLELVVQCDETLSEDNRKLMSTAVEQVCETITFIEMNAKTLEDYPEASLWHQIVWYKILAPELGLFDGKPFFHLDSDMFVVQNFEDEFEDFVKSNKPIGVVPEPRRNVKFEKAFTLPTDAANWYFNAGLIFFNQAVLNRNNYDFAWRYILQNYHELELDSIDQDVLNLTFETNYHKLPFSLNAHNKTMKNRYQYAIKNYHFIWKFKPWLVPNNSVVKFLTVFLSSYSVAFRRYWDYEDEVMRNLSTEISEQLLQFRNVNTEPISYFLQARIKDSLKIATKVDYFLNNRRKYNSTTWKRVRRESRFLKWI